MLEAKAISKTYLKKMAVKHLSFSIGKGEIWGFLGPNGAGKSTTIKMLTGCLVPDHGAIEFNGVSLEQDRIQIQAKLGYMPEHSPLPGEFRIIEYLKHRAGIKHIPKREHSNVLERVLCQAHVKDNHKQLIGQLSKGFRQRVNLADALLTDPEYLILDEPTSGLDPNQVAEFRELIQSFRGKKTVLWSTHVLSEIENTCSHVLMIHEGKLVYQGPLVGIRNFESAGVMLFARFKGTDMALKRFLETCAELSMSMVGSEKPDEHHLKIDHGNDAIAEFVSEKAVDAGLRLLELSHQRQNLEGRFQALTQATQAPVTQGPVTQGPGLEKSVPECKETT